VKARIRKCKFKTCLLGSHTKSSGDKTSREKTFGDITSVGQNVCRDKTSRITKRPEGQYIDIKNFKNNIDIKNFKNNTLLDSF
jgi:hypothetical protein